MARRRHADLITLLNKTEQDGLWSYLPGKKPALEPSIWAAVALRHDETTRKRFLERLTGFQNSDGGWSNTGTKSDWTTGLALLGLRLLLTESELAANPSFKKGVSFLLDNRTDYHTGPGKFFLLLTLGAEYDYPRGWPWTEKTYDWVEPTAYALLAMDGTELCSGPKARNAVKQAKRFLLQCALTHGGWDYAARDPADPAHVPYPANTAQAILALPDYKNARTIKTASEYLSRNDPQHNSTLALAWSTIALDFLGSDTREKLETLGAKIEKDLDNKKETFPPTDTVSLALSCIACGIAELGNPFLFSSPTRTRKTEPVPEKKP